MTGRGDERKLRGMNDSSRDRVDQNLEDAFAARGIEDPRAFYREWLRALRERDARAFEEARRYYETVLLPRITDEGADPVAEWLEYGRRLAELSGAGRLVDIDETGRAKTTTPPLPSGRLVLYLPDSTREPARVVNLPRRLSDAQQATYDLLIEGRTGVR